jgi:ABC-type branched-subunit amino acid transport system ATPase component/predicted MFS family arabinose efflux permease
VIPVAPLAVPDAAPWAARARFAVRHPGRWLTDLSGGGPVYALAVLFGFNMVEEMDRDAFGLLIPNIQKSFHLSNAGILSLVAVAALLGLSLTVPIAQLSDTRGRVRLMLIGGAVFALFSFGTGLAAFAWVLVIMRSGSGLGQATALPTHNSLMSDWFPIAARPRVFSLYRLANALGAFVGPLLAGLLAAWIGWRAPFIVLAVPTVILVILGLRLIEPVRGLQERGAMGMQGDALATEEPPPSFAESWRMLWKVTSLRRVFYSLPFLAASIIGFASLAALLYQHAFGLGTVERAYIAALTEPVQVVGLVIGARFGSRLITRDPSLIIRFLAIAAWICGGFAAVFALAPWLWLTIVANMAITATLAVVGPGVFAALSLGIPPRARSMGFSLGAIWVIPGLIVLPIVGAVSDSIGIRPGMLIMTPVFVAGGLVLAGSRRALNADILQVWTMAAARSEVLNERRHGRVKLLLCRGLQVFYGNVQVLFDVDFEIGEGEIVALLGTNGAGKSTLLKAICGVVEADRGAVIFDGRDITHAPPNEIAALGVGLVPGDQRVFPSLTVRENLRVAGWLEHKNSGGAAARLARVLDQFPVLRAQLDEPAANLSGGQQQMLALGMSFLGRPRLLLIDELSLGLAPVMVQQLLPMIAAIRDQGTTVIIVEQSVNLALTIAETAYFMEKGEIRFHGPTAELLERPDILRSVFLEGAGTGADGLAATPSPAGDAPASRASGPAAAALDAAGWTTRPVAAAPAAQADPAAAALEVMDLRVRFGGIQAVGGVSLRAAPGEIVGIIGPNGAGKTTLFDLISGFTRADAGRVLLGGRELTGRGPDQRARSGLGRSFQDAQLFPALTVEETIAVAMDRWVAVKDPLNPALHLPAAYDSEQAVRQRADELIELLSLGAFRTKFVHELSTGSRRVVDLACVLAQRPSVVLLDEPSSGIAQRESEALVPLLLRLRDELGAALLVIEHDMPLVSAVADRLVALDQGLLVADGPPQEVLHDPVVVSSYLGDNAAAIARSGVRHPDAIQPVD